MNLGINTSGGALRRPLFLSLSVLLMFTLCWAAPAKKPTVPKRGVTASTKTEKKGAGARRVSSRKKPSWRNTQMRPTPERYSEIQKALITRGYLQGAPSGVWDESSAAALRRFQSDQNLEPSGKLDSLSLIALGLGPSYRASSPPAETPQSQP